MLLTDKFVFIHLPKCGGTFVTAMLKVIHSPSRVLCGVPLPAKTDREVGPLFDTHQWATKHDGCYAIPDSHRDKPIVSVIRNPYDRYVSQYHFRWWEKRPDRCGINLEEARRNYPNFPELTFEQFLKLMNERIRFRQNPNVRLTEHLGNYSARFLITYFREPENVNPRIDDEYLAQQRYLEDMYPVRFLRTERLNQELYDFLLSVGYPESRISCILDARRIRPDSDVQRERDKWERYFTPELKAFVRAREKLIFSIFPEFDD